MLLQPHEFHTVSHRSIRVFWLFVFKRFISTVKCALVKVCFVTPSAFCFAVSTKANSPDAPDGMFYFNFMGYEICLEKGTGSWLDDGSFHHFSTVLIASCFGHSWTLLIALISVLSKVGPVKFWAGLKINITSVFSRFRMVSSWMCEILDVTSVQVQSALSPSSLWQQHLRTGENNSVGASLQRAENEWKWTFLPKLRHSDVFITRPVFAGKQSMSRKNI